MDYGTSNQAWPNGANWKTTGADCLDGVIYGFIANNWYGYQSAYGDYHRDAFLRQSVTNMSLIKSTDKGLLGPPHSGSCRTMATAYTPSPAPPM